MPLLFLGLGISLLTAAILTQHIFRQAYVWESNQISVDNSAIEFGRELRKIMNDLQSSNRALLQLDRFHDFAHLCALAPGPQQAKCKIADLAFEKKIDGSRYSAQWAAEELWKRSRANLLTQLKTKGLEILFFSGKGDLPKLRDVLCARCRRKVQMEIDSTDLPIQAGIQIRGAPRFPVAAGVVLVGRSLLGSEEWNYQLNPEPAMTTAK